ncbi:MAG: proton-conducting transporter membrane subunit, partial [Halobacteria archaeon]|nr:proton-conducting transporter membrane subunit [Halobacteria archaeon]
MALVDHLAISPMLIALATAVFTLLIRRYQRVQTAVSLLGSFSILGATFLVAEKARDTILVYRLGGDLVKDGIPFGILLEVDQLSAFMMLFSAFVMSSGLVYSVFFISKRGQRVSYHSLWHLLTFGTMGAFSTGDLFNLFVWFEVLLMSSYILVVFYSNQEATRSALYYVTLNLVGSAIMLLAI